MSAKLGSLLIVEDSNEDFTAMERFLRRSSSSIPIERCTDGDQALAFLFQRGNYMGYPYPSMIILDLNLPGTNGLEVLHFIKNDTRLERIPVVVFTTSNNPNDRQECCQYGVKKYIIKPIDYGQLKQNMQLLIDLWFEIITVSKEVEN